MNAWVGIANYALMWLKISFRIESWEPHDHGKCEHLSFSDDGKGRKV